MFKNRNVAAELRRDVGYLWRAVIAIVFIGFAAIVVAAALYDVLSWRH